ncbi:MAG: NADP oxidoreductase [Thermodesulfovibrionales bacterium]
MQKVKFATIWLDGCSGCHMSLLDIDERLIDVFSKVEVVYGPLVDYKKFPSGVDVTFVEGAVSSDEDVEKILEIRNKTKVLVSFGDCAVTSNIPGMRNYYKIKDLMQRAYDDNAEIKDRFPRVGIPHLISHSRPIHEFVTVDVFLPGCPPPADVIHYVIMELVEGRIPNLTGRTRFGQ